MWAHILHNNKTCNKCNKSAQEIYAIPK
jgi:hypothetical protein